MHINKHIHDISQSEPEHESASIFLLLVLLHFFRPVTKCDEVACSNSLSNWSRSEQLAITSVKEIETHYILVDTTNTIVHAV